MNIATSERATRLEAPSDAVSELPPDTDAKATPDDALAGIDDFGTEAAAGPLAADAVAPAASPSAQMTLRSPSDTAVLPAGTPAPAVRAQTRDWPRWVMMGLAALVLIQAPFVMMWALRSAGVIGSATGKLAVETDPAGIEVLVDGRSVGRSPVELTLPAGTRNLVLRQGALSRSLPIEVTPGETVRHRFEFVAAAATAVTSSTGTLQVTTEPTRAVLVLDGTPRGATPLTLSDLPQGEHTLSVRFATGTVERKVDILAGGTATMHVVSPTTSSAAAGWLSVDVASPLQIFEQGRLVGTTNIGRLLLPPGVHVLDFVSDELGFRTQRSITVTPGAATAVRLDLPPATLSVNAQPWAEVWVDGERVGETPLGNLSRPLGRHEVVLRHPELGERRQTITLTSTGPNRVSVDLRQRP